MNKKQLEEQVEYLSRQQTLLMRALNHAVSGRLEATELLPAEGALGGLIHLKLYDAAEPSGGIVVQINEAPGDNPLLTSTIAFYLEDRIEPRMLRLFDSERPGYSAALRRLLAKRNEIAEAVAKPAP